MKKSVLNTLIYIFFISSMTNFAHAFDIDETVDDEIRKNYNSSKLINDVGLKQSPLEKNIESNSNNFDENLPALPSITNSTKTELKQKAQIQTQNLVPYKGGIIRVKSGTSFDVESITAMSDWQRSGTKVKFITKKNIFGKDYTIPASTTFLGEIVESHQPQITCNGGLIVIRINSMIYKNQSIPINAYITRANNKKIFFNTIKGNRTFLKTMWKKGNWGRTLFNKMLNLTINLGGEGSTLILSPFPIAYGTICLGANAITSPICAFFSKGGHISLPAGSQFRIKLTEDVMIN